MKNKKDSVLSNMIWRFAEKWGCQLVSFVVTIIIARLIDPEVYGIVAIINTFIQIFTVFVDGGLGNSLIQKKNADDVDYSTVFYSNLILCVSVYFILFFSSPLIAKFYEMPQLKDLIRVASISIVVYSYKDIQHAYVAKNMMFRKFFFSSLLGTIGSGVIGIVLAYKGYGCWALVFSNLFDVVVDTLVLFFMIDWRPKLIFSINRFKSLFSYGWKILVSSLLERLYNKSYHLVIGKFCSAQELAYYDKGNSLTSKVSDNVDSVINSVLFPVLSNEQDDKEKVKSIAKKTLKTNSYIMTPLLIGIIAISEPMVTCLLTNKWIFVVPYIRLFCIINIFLPLQSINLNIIKAVGRSDIYLKQETYKKVLGIIILLITIRFNALAVLLGKTILSLISIFINSYPNKKLINYGIMEQMKDICSNLLIGTIMGICVYCVLFIGLSSLPTLIIQVLVGMMVYISLSAISKNESFVYLFNIVKKNILARK